MLVRVPVDSANSIPYFDRLWCNVESLLACYCLQWHGSKGPDVDSIIAERMDPLRMRYPAKVFAGLEVNSKSAGHKVANAKVKSALECMTPVPTDKIGFDKYCQAAQLAWLTVGYVRALAAKPGPFPRHQELPPGSHIVGVPPRGRRKFVVSHGWESEAHPSPGGGQMVSLASMLNLLGAMDDDVVFYDYCAYPQATKVGCMLVGDSSSPPRNALAPAYFEYNKIAFAPQRAGEEVKRCKIAMWDLNRVYAFEECEVIVIAVPPLDADQMIATFPGGNTWGRPTTTPYQMRGWCYSEFSISLYTNRIANLKHPQVQSLLESRKWPRTLEEYAEVLGLTCSPEGEADLKFDAAQGVHFTSKGDRTMVKYKFFKMTVSPQDMALTLSENDAPAEP